MNLSLGWGESLTTYKRISNDFRLVGTLLLVMFIAAYWVPLKSIVHTWMTNDDYSYGFLIPIISAYLFWDMRDRLRGLSFKNSWGTLPVLVLMILISLYGILGSSGNIAMLAIPVLIILFFIFCFGTVAFKRFFLPLCFLIFIVPLPPFLDRTIGVFLKALSSQLGGFFIKLCGLSVHVSGNVIDLGVTQLQVVDACSGLRFLFPLIALGIIYAYFFEQANWKRMVCVAATIPIAIFANGLRIGITGILTKYFGPSMAEGFFHDFSGWAIFIVAFGFLFIFGRFLRLVPPKHERRMKGAKIDMKVVPMPLWTGPNIGLIVSIALLLVVGILSATTGAMPPIKIKGSIGSFPKTIHSWVGKQTYIDPEIVDRSGAEEAYAGTYRNGAGDVVSLYMGYRQSAFLENENFFHSPTVCLPSAGWENKSQTKHRIDGMPLWENFIVTQMVIEQMESRQLVNFWFQTKDQATYSKDINRFHLALHALKNDNTHDLFIRLMTPIKNDETVVEAQTRMDQFAREMMDTLLLFLEKNQFVGDG